MKNLILSCINLKKLTTNFIYYRTYHILDENYLEILQGLNNLEELSTVTAFKLSTLVVDFVTSNEVKLKRLKNKIDCVENFEEQKELSSRLSRNKNIQSTVFLTKEPRKREPDSEDNLYYDSEYEIF